MTPRIPVQRAPSSRLPATHATSAAASREAHAQPWRAPERPRAEGEPRSFRTWLREEQSVRERKGAGLSEQNPAEESRSGTWSAFGQPEVERQPDAAEGGARTISGSLRSTPHLLDLPVTIESAGGPEFAKALLELPNGRMIHIETRGARDIALGSEDEAATGFLERVKGRLGARGFLCRDLREPRD